MVHKALDWFLWGLFMGAGWLVAGNLLNFLATFIHR